MSCRTPLPIPGILCSVAKKAFVLRLVSLCSLNISIKYSDVKPSVKGAPIASKDREPLVDVFIEDKVVRVIVELPGVSKDDVNVKTTESKIIITAEGNDRNYSAERDLSVKIKPKTASAKYRNGILELVVERKEPIASENGFEVKIE